MSIVVINKYYYLFKKIVSPDFFYIRNNDLLEEIKSKYNIQKWEKVIDYINRLNVTNKRQFLITKRSLKLATKIKKEIGVDVFPIVIRQYLGSMHNEEGYCTWYMLDRDMNMIGSADSTSDLLLKKNIIEICWYESSNIYISFCLKGEKNV